MRLKALLSILFCLCLKYTYADHWIQMANFQGTARQNAVSFSIGNKGYIGLGKESPVNQCIDFWEWNDSSHTWMQKANFPENRESAAAFSIGRKGYVGTGYVNTGMNAGYRNDFYEFDPDSNTWTPKTNFPGAKRQDAVGFSIGTKGYFGTGDQSSGILYNDFYEYDPGNNSWSVKDSLPGVRRTGAAGFSIGNKGFIGTGWSAGTLLNDFWEYNQSTGNWIQKINFPGSNRTSGIGFSIGNKGYLGTGENGFFTYQDIFEYDTAGVWNTCTPHPNQVTRAVAFSICSHGYVGTGFLSGTLNQNFNQYTPSNVPGAGFMTSQYTVCLGACINFIDTSTNSATQWNWDFGNGNNSTLQNPTNICFNSAGNFSVSLSTLSDSICHSVVTNTITVNDSSDTFLCTIDGCDHSTGIVTHTPVNTDDSNPCTSDACDPATGDTIHTNITPNAPSVSVMDSCGYSVLTANGATGSLIWNTTATTISITTITSGNFWATQTVNGCTGPADSATASPYPIPTTPVIVPDTNGMISVTQPILGTYNWYKNGVLQSDTVSTILYHDGNYYVTVTDTNGCTSDSSNNIMITGIQNSNYLESAMSITPNPSSGDFTLQINNVNVVDDVHLVISDIIGRIVYAQDYFIMNATFRESFHLRLTKGLYIVRLSNRSLNLTRNLIIE